jgi:hypothetical protein
MDCILPSVLEENASSPETGCANRVDVLVGLVAEEHLHRIVLLVLWTLLLFGR